jgi:serine protease Do
VSDLPYFDVFEAAKRPVGEAGTGILGFSNQFQIATRDEPMSVQFGRIASYTKIAGRRGIFEAPYQGEVYVLDAITNNPGAGGGALTTTKGELLGLIGKELRNELTNTWVNYAVPINAKVEVTQDDNKKVTVSILDLVEKKDKYKSPIDPEKLSKKGSAVHHGIVLVPNVLERTPPYIEEVMPGSPADKAKLKPDDLIVYVDGLPVGSIETLEETLARYRPGMEVRLEIQRGTKLHTVALKLEEPLKKKTPPKK